MSKLSYAAKFAQMDREAAATLTAAIAVTAFFWLAIFFLGDDPLATLFSMPLWFVVSCIGGYLISVLAVIVLIRCCLKNFDLDD